MIKWRDANKKLPKHTDDACVLILDHTDEAGEFTPIVTFGHYSQLTGWKNLKNDALPGDVIFWMQIPRVPSKMLERREENEK